MWHVLLGALVLLSPQAAPIPMGPTDAIGFDYEIAELINAQVTHFERRSDANGNTGTWSGYRDSDDGRGRCACRLEYV